MTARLPLSCHEMLQYFYIIYVLVCIKYTICYNYYDTDLNQKYMGKKARQFHSNTVSAEDKLPVDKDLVAQVDVADFIQNSDDDALDEDIPYDNIKRNEYDDYSSLIGTNSQESDNVKDKSPDYLNPGQNSVELNDATPGKEMNSKYLSMNTFNNGKKLEDKKLLKKNNYYDAPLNFIHNPEKKCSFKNMKIPFFSHNKSKIEKKQKKRRMFSFHNKKIEDNKIKSSGPSEKMTITKRSYEDELTLCPACRRKYKKKSNSVNERNKRLDEKTLHNSRQFYAALSEGANLKFGDKYRFNNIGDAENPYYAVSIENERRKRDEIDEKERRIKELEEIQKKLEEIDLQSLNKQN